MRAVAERTGFGARLRNLFVAARTIDEDTWDEVIVDCGPSADLLRTVAAPELLLGYLDRLWPQPNRMAALLGVDPRLAVLANTVERMVAGVGAVRALPSVHALATRTPTPPSATRPREREPAMLVRLSKLPHLKR